MTPPARRMLVVTRSIITPAHHGGCAYPAGLLQQLADAGWQIDLLWLGAGDRAAPPANWCPPAVRQLVVPGAVVVAGRAWSRHPRVWWRALTRRAAALRPAGTATAASEAEVAAAHAAAVRLKPAAWLVNHTRLAGVLAARGHAEGWLLTHEVVHQRAESYRRAGLAPDFPVLDAATEAAAWGLADRLIAISPADAEVLRANGRPVIVMPPTPPGPPLDPGACIAGRVLFVGSANAANRDAANWLLGEIWPRVRAAVPAASLDVVGYVGRDLPTPLPAGVRRLDHVVDLCAAYAAARVVAVPVRAGAGLKLKLWEAIHYGRPAVTTTEGARGWPEWQQGVLPIADDPQTFANHLIGLLTDPQAWSAAATALAEWREHRPE